MPSRRSRTEYGGKINTVLQLRLHPRLIELRDKIMQERSGRQYEVELAYVTGRGPWYHQSWKGSIEKSGGIATNIGIHLFDLLIWLFGQPGDCQVFHSDPDCMSGFLELEHARVRWFLSIDQGDLPFAVLPGQRSTYRSITIDGEEVDFTEGFTDLHTRVYEETLAGRGFSIDDSRPSIKLTFQIRNSPLTPITEAAHPMLKRRMTG